MISLVLRLCLQDFRHRGNDGRCGNGRVFMWDRSLCHRWNIGVNIKNNRLINGF